MTSLIVALLLSQSQSVRVDSHFCAPFDGETQVVHTNEAEPVTLRALCTYDRTAKTASCILSDATNWWDQYYTGAVKVTPQGVKLDTKFVTAGPQGGTEYRLVVWFWEGGLAPSLMYETRHNGARMCVGDK